MDAVADDSRASAGRKRRMTRRSTQHALYRRSPTLVIHWHGERPIAQDYALGLRHTIDDRAFTLLTKLTGWTRAGDLPSLLPDDDPQALQDRLDALVAARLVERSGDPAVHARSAPIAWASWAPEAALFHFATKNVRRLTFEEATRQLYANLAMEEYPDTVKAAPPHAGAAIALPPFDTHGSLPDVLRSRRTWRRFGSEPLAFDHLATLLGLTWGVQQWMRIGPEIRSALKTSPSGGACHSLEAYVIARRVNDLQPGIYHYNPDAHTLTRVRKGLPADPLVTYLGGQPWYRDANALFVMTSVIARAEWKYRFPRAYRSVLLEAGHFCQTFCLLATWLGLAPFCTGLFADAIVERALRIDGVEETAIYVAGVGSRPSDLDWAPMPDGHRSPGLELPAYRTGEMHRAEDTTIDRTQPVHPRG